jgi:hypothetical protein
MLTAALVVVATRAPVAPAVERIWSAVSVATLRVADDSAISPCSTSPLA